MYRPADILLVLTLAKQPVARGALSFPKIFYVTPVQKRTIPIPYDIIAQSRDAIRGVKGREAVSHDWIF